MIKRIGLSKTLLLLALGLPFAMTITGALQVYLQYQSTIDYDASFDKAIDSYEDIYNIGSKLTELNSLLVNTIRSNDIEQIEKNVALIEKDKKIILEYLADCAASCTKANELFAEYTKQDQIILNTFLNGQAAQAQESFFTELSSISQKLFVELDNVKNSTGIQIQNDKSAISAKVKKNISLGIIVFALVCLVITIVSLSIRSVINKEFISLVRDLNQNAHEIDSLSSNLKKSSNNLNDKSTTTVSALVQTSASLTELGAMVDKNKEDAEESKKFSFHTFEQAKYGFQKVEEMLAAMQQIESNSANILKSIENGTQDMLNLITYFKEIGDKTQIINDIVFQTKILSFNASVEAARAGEHGRGFAIVAQEIGKLAEVSGKAAIEITDILSKNMTAANQTVDTVRSSTQKVVVESKQSIVDGSSTAKNCQEALNSIIGSIQKVTDSASRIAEATKEQSQAMEQVNQAIYEIDNSTKQNALEAHSLFKASEDLTTYASSLSERSLFFEKFIFSKNRESNQAVESENTVQNDAVFEILNSEKAA